MTPLQPDQPNLFDKQYFTVTTPEGFERVGDSANCRLRKKNLSCFVAIFSDYLYNYTTWFITLCARRIVGILVNER